MFVLKTAFGVTIMAPLRMRKSVAAVVRCLHNGETILAVLPAGCGAVCFSSAREPFPRSHIHGSTQSRRQRE